MEKHNQSVEEYLSAMREARNYIIALGELLDEKAPGIEVKTKKFLETEDISLGGEIIMMTRSIDENMSRKVEDCVRTILVLKAMELSIYMTAGEEGLKQYKAERELDRMFEERLIRYNQEARGLIDYLKRIEQMNNPYEHEETGLEIPEGFQIINPEDETENRIR